MRQRFKNNRICSSENYESSMRVHQKDLKENHAKLNNMIVKEEIVLKKTAYIKVFGKLIKLDNIEIPLYEGKTTIIYM